MGTAESHFCEWVELHNNGAEPVDISDWKLKVDDSITNLADGEGVSTVPASGYLLIERVTNTCPDPVPKVSGRKITFAGLPNSGATVALLRADDSLEDQVAGGKDWSNIGGDNESKDTAQRTNGGWVTAEATPGSQNQTDKTTQPEEASSASESKEAESSSTTKDDSQGGDSNQLVQSTDELILKLKVPKTGYVNKSIVFSVEPVGTNEVVRNSLQYQWNFGDLNASQKKETTHTYKRPGTYVVTLFATFATREVLARQEITILPITTEITRAENGDVQLYNSAPYDLDLSGYQLVGDKRIAFPEYSLLASKETLTIPRERLENGSFGYVALYNPEGDMIASNYGELRSEPETIAENNWTATATTITTTTKPTPQVSGVAIGTNSTTTATTNRSSNTNTKNPPWYYRYWEYIALSILISIAIVLIAPPRFIRNKLPVQQNDPEKF